jgi:hypothetical protein
MPMIKHRHIAMPLEQLAHQAEFAGVLRGDAEFVARLGHRVFHAALLGHGQTDFRANGLGDPALLLHFLPGHIVFLGADEREDFVLQPILTNERGGQAEPPARLQRRGNLKHRRRQQVHLVIDDQPPVALVEELEMGELALLARAVRENLIGGNGNRADFLLAAAVFANVLLGQGRLVEQLALPLAGGGDAGGQDERRGPHQGHARHPHDGLARAARQHDHARTAAFRAASMKYLRRLALVIARGEWPARNGDGAQSQRESLADQVPREVFGGETQLDEGVFQAAPFHRRHREFQFAQPDAQQRRQGLLMGQFLRQRQVARARAAANRRPAGSI